MHEIMNAQTQPKTTLDDAPGSGKLATFPGWREVRSRTRTTDERIGDLYRGKLGERSKGVALLALGGYGRRELCPHSDIDLMFLIDKKLSESKVRDAIAEVVYPLWDDKLDISYSVRTPKQALIDAKDDFLLLTALLDARLLCGDEESYRDWKARFNKDILVGRRKQIVENLVSHGALRHKQCGDDTYSLEPDIKEGQGGLRDYHTMLWTAKALAGETDVSRIRIDEMFGNRDRAELEEAINFLLYARCVLHALSKRKNDRLRFEYLGALADTLGFRGESLERTIESFMLEFHHQVFCIKVQNEAFLDRAKDKLSIFRDGARFRIDPSFEVLSGRVAFSSPESLPADPHLMIALFEHMARFDRPMHPTAREVVRNHLNLVESSRISPLAKRAFRRTVAAKGAQRALVAMLETGVLGRFLPEFERLRGRMQFDIYHTSTVDYHSIRTVQELMNLERSQTEVFQRIKDKELLFFIALLHDIGKGYGSPHSEIGADMAFDTLQNFGFSEKQAETARHIIQKHLVLSETATRRDITEEKTVFGFAESIGNVEALCMLYLLTIADATATGPTALGSWKELLIRELFLKSLKIMEKGALRDPGAAGEFEERREALRAQAPSILGDETDARLEALPHQYVMSYETPAILKHLEMSQKVKTPCDVAVLVEPRGSNFDVTVLATDRIGLFAKLAGVFALNHLDIRGAKVFTWHNRLAVDVFEVAPPWSDYDRWDKVISDFKLAAGGKMALAAAISGVRPPLNGTRKPKLEKKPRVVTDNSASDFFTVIEVYAPDQVGLLYRIARAISELDLDIFRALISNKGDLSADVFYVSNLQKEKIEDPDQLKAVEEAILYSLK
ncbi:MAG: [protein-PII] uridylyltransferase, partial [Deltaproteobacteria bacterium]|nr:[protein-PII] uridylyltransferase [Deltaproteobacteria bacterium]